MANNRIYLACKECGERLYLGKTYGQGYFWEQYNGKCLQMSLNEFFDRHDNCGETCYEVEYDHADRD